VEPSAQESKELVEWPASGDIEFNDYKMRYRPGNFFFSSPLCRYFIYILKKGLDLVLRGITCAIKTNEKVGRKKKKGLGVDGNSMVQLFIFIIILYIYFIIIDWNCGPYWCRKIKVRWQ
jgi:hypothetical protein